MPPVEDVKEVMEEVSVQVLIGDEDSESKVANEGGEDVTGDEDDEDEEDVDEDEDEDDDEEEEDLGTEYLVKPVGEGCEDDDEDSSDFNPEENGVDDDIDDDDEEDEIEDDISKLSAGKSEPRTKRKRVAKEEHSEQEASATGEEGDVRPSKR
ncbi:unnamed protein product [Cochlearia groenlandica]